MKQVKRETIHKRTYQPFTVISMLTGSPFPIETQLPLYQGEDFFHRKEPPNDSKPQNFDKCWIQKKLRVWVSKVKKVICNSPLKRNEFKPFMELRRLAKEKLILWLFKRKNYAFQHDIPLKFFDDTTEAKVASQEISIYTSFNKSIYTSTKKLLQIAILSDFRFP